MVVSLGVVLGFMTLARWAPYDEYSPVVIALYIYYVVAVLFGLVVGLLNDSSVLGMATAAALVVIAMAFPVCATAATSVLLGNTAILDLILYRAIQQALVWSAPLLVFAFVGMTVGLIVQSTTS